MPSTPAAPLPPLRRWRDDPDGEWRGAGGLAPWLDGGPEDERTPARAEPLVLAPGATLVAYDGGRAGRAALAEAVRALPGPIGIVHVYDPVDPVRALGVADVPGGAGGALRSVARDNARLLADAMGVALAGVAIAQEGDRVATALVAPDDGSGRAATLAGVAARHRAGRLVIAAPPAALRWRRVGGLSTAEQLVRRAPCPVVVVPLDGG